MVIAQQKLLNCEDSFNMDDKFADILRSLDVVTLICVQLL